MKKKVVLRYPKDGEFARSLDYSWWEIVLYCTKFGVFLRNPIRFPVKKFKDLRDVGWHIPTYINGLRFEKKLRDTFWVKYNKAIKSRIRRRQKTWFFFFFYYPKKVLLEKRKLNCEAHGLHIIKKQSVFAVLISIFVGLLPLFVYFVPLYGSIDVGLYFVYLLGLFFGLGLWFICIFVESRIYHTFRVQKGLINGFMLFILSEIMFFFSIFWSFFYFRVEPVFGLGSHWPPVGLDFVAHWGLPTLNTIILLISGVFVTYAHQSLLLGKRKESMIALSFTIILGMLFTSLQWLEYQILVLEINSSVFGSIFFFATGFHGIHVLIGSIFLGTCLFELFRFRVYLDQHISLECAIWYWHFVDVVWLFLFVFIYCLGA